MPSFKTWFVGIKSIDSGHIDMEVLIRNSGLILVAVYLLFVVEITYRVMYIDLNIINFNAA